MLHRLGVEVKLPVISGFWWRRTPRILPLLATMAGATILLACSAGAPGPSDDPIGGQELETSPPVLQTANVMPAGLEVRGRLDFPLREELTFDTTGEVEEVLVSAGDRVVEGQTLARLNTDIFPALDEEVSRLRLQIAEAEVSAKALNLDFSGEPVLAAQWEENIARLIVANAQAQDLLDDVDRNFQDRLAAMESARDQAKVARDAAAEALTEAQRDEEVNHAQVLAAAERESSEAEMALDQARESLQDYREDLSDEAIRSGDRVNQARLALDQAQDRLDDYRQDVADNSVRAGDRVSEAEVALDLAKQALDDFLDEHDRRVFQARTLVGAADSALDAANVPLTQFLRSPTRVLEDDDKPVDTVRLNALQAAVDLAESNLAQAQDDLAELEEGPDILKVQELRFNVDVAEVNLAQAQEDLAELEEGPDPLLLQELESSVAVAQVNLDRASEDLAELEEGPDVLVLNQLQAQVDLAEARAEQARRRLADEMDGPDPLILSRLSVSATEAQRRLDLAERELQDLIEDRPDLDAFLLMDREVSTRRAQIDELYERPDGVKQAQIDSLHAAISVAEERIADILEEKDKHSLVAPHDGIIYVVNVEEDDRVGEHSQVMELIDPNNAMIKGFVDATDIGTVGLGTPALVRMDSMPGADLTGVVSHVSDIPRTERGIISYAVNIDLDLAPGQVVPPRLTSVDVVLLP